MRKGVTLSFVSTVLSYLTLFLIFFTDSPLPRKEGRFDFTIIFTYKNSELLHV